MEYIYLVFSITFSEKTKNKLYLELATMDRHKADEKAEYLIKSGRYYQTIEHPLDSMKPEMIFKF